MISLLSLLVVAGASSSSSAASRRARLHELTRRLDVAPALPRPTDLRARVAWALGVSVDVPALFPSVRSAEGFAVLIFNDLFPEVPHDPNDALPPAGLRSPREYLVPWLFRTVMHEFRRGNHDFPAHEVAEVVDWIDATRPDLTQLTWDDAQIQSAGWHERISDPEEAFQPVPIYLGDVVLYTWPDGSTMVELKSRVSLEAEGKSMNHCVGGHWADVRDRGHRVISYRHLGKWPAATLQIAPPITEGGPPIIIDLEAWENYQLDEWRGWSGDPTDEDSILMDGLSLRVVAAHAARRVDAWLIHAFGTNLFSSASNRDRLLGTVFLVNEVALAEFTRISRLDSDEMKAFSTALARVESAREPNFHCLVGNVSCEHALFTVVHAVDPILRSLASALSGGPVILRDTSLVPISGEPEGRSRGDLREKVYLKGLEIRAIEIVAIDASVMNGERIASFQLSMFPGRPHVRGHVWIYHRGSQNLSSFKVNGSSDLDERTIEDLFTRLVDLGFVTSMARIPSILEARTRDTDVEWAPKLDDLPSGRFGSAGVFRRIRRFIEEIPAAFDAFRKQGSSVVPMHLTRQASVLLGRSLPLVHLVEVAPSDWASTLHNAGLSSSFPGSSIEAWSDVPSRSIYLESGRSSADRDEVLLHELLHIGGLSGETWLRRSLVEGLVVLLVAVAFHRPLPARAKKYVEWATALDRVLRRARLTPVEFARIVLAQSPSESTPDRVAEALSVRLPGVSKDRIYDQFTAATDAEHLQAPVLG